MSRQRANSTVVKLAVPDDLLPTIDAVVADAGQPRSHWILDAIQQRLNPSNKPDSPSANYARAATAVLKATNGKLTRQEAEHCVALVITSMAHGR